MLQSLGSQRVEPDLATDQQPWDSWHYLRTVLFTTNGKVQLVPREWRSGIKPVTPTLAGGFPTTERAGEPRIYFVLDQILLWIELLLFSH